MIDRFIGVVVRGAYYDERFYGIRLTKLIYLQQQRSI